MQEIRVVTDTAQYQKQLKTSDPSRYREVSDQELKSLPADAYILTGEKTKDFGGGPSPDGFVINDGKLIGRLRLLGRFLHRGKLTI